MENKSFFYLLFVIVMFTNLFRDTCKANKRKFARLSWLSKQFWGDCLLPSSTMNDFIGVFKSCCLFMELELGLYQRTTDASNQCYRVWGLHSRPVISISILTFDFICSWNPPSIPKFTDRHLCTWFLWFDGFSCKLIIFSECFTAITTITFEYTLRDQEPKSE